MFFHNFYASKENFKYKIFNYQVEGTFENSYSLSMVNKAVARALNAHSNSTIRLDPTQWHKAYMDEVKDLEPDIIALSEIELEYVDISIRNIYPPHTKDMEAKIKIIGPYGWEESKFPPEYVKDFNRDLTMVFAMSSYVKNLLKENGVTVPITITGLIVEDILSIKSKPLSFNLPNGFKLLHISSLFPRKGIEVLLEAFDTLEDGKNISLIIKSFPNPHNNILEQLNALNFLLETTYEKDIYLYKRKSKQILLINKNIPQSKIKYLYENSNLLVAPSFGEGFGLPMAEAMLMELPVLTTGYGGQCDFCTPQTSWLIDFNFQEAKTYFNLENSLWAVPTLLSLQQQILTIYHLSSDKIADKVIPAKAYILENYSSKRVTQNMLNIIKKFIY